ncbi:MAG: Gldg family protein [Verrucomicrobiae bacterium]|nr:Gldg family protein [Verrucomicrobiae bacterium]
MALQSKILKHWLFSTLGVVSIFVLLIGLNLIFNVVPSRFDFTESKLYTLSQGTEKILQKIQGPIVIRFYATRKDTAMPVFLKNYADTIENLLLEFQKKSKGKIQVETYDPEPDSDAEDSARIDGVRPQPLQTGSDIYLGISFSALDHKISIPFLSPERASLLEYDIARSLVQVTSTQKPVIGIVTSLPVFGDQPDKDNLFVNQRLQPPWTLISELQRDFDVKPVGLDAEEIPKEINVLLVIHPLDFSKKLQFAIDQFVMLGGRLAVFLDPYSIADMSRAPAGNMPMPRGSTLDDLLKGWGYSFDKTKVVADLTYKTPINQGRGVIESPVVLSLDKTAVNSEDPATSQIDNLLFAFSGFFTGKPVAGLRQEVLVHSSSNVMSTEAISAYFQPEKVLENFHSDQTVRSLVVRLSGKFKTAFPSGQPQEGTNSVSATKPFLKESSSDTFVLLVGDSDFLTDQFSVRVQGFLGQRIAIPLNGNLNFAQNLIEQLAGDSDLIEVRSRATLQRPFTRLKRLEAEANERYRSKIQALEKDLEETQNRLNELQSKKGATDQFIVSAEQQSEIDRFATRRAEVKKELKELRKDLRHDITSLENLLKWINIGVMPLVVIIVGLVLFLKRKRKS